MLNRFRVLLTIASFILLSYSLLIIASSPAKGYELSIYSATPRIFWIAIIFGLFNGFLLIISCFYHRSKIWIVGLFEILFCNCLIISLYALRGYVLCFGRGDVGSYVGYAKDISSYGYYGSSNIYPITFIFISQLNQLTTISIMTLSKYLPSFFFVFYVLSVYCWSKSIIPDRRFVLSSLLASTVIFFAWFSTSIYTQLLSVWTLPFFFYLLQKKPDYRFKLFCIIFLIMYPFFHPITAIVVLLYLTTSLIWEKFDLDAKEKYVSTSLLLISFVTLFGWFIQQYTLLRNMKTILFQLIGLLNIPTTADQTLYNMNKLGVATAIRTLGLMISDEIVFCVLSLIVIYRVFFSKKEISILQKFYKISIFFIIGNLFLLIVFFSTRAHTQDRLINLNFNLVLTPPLVGYLLYTFLLNNKRAKSALILSLIFSSAIIAMFSLYPSPITMLRNKQVTIKDVSGINWLISNKNPELKTADVASPVFRFAELINGCNFLSQRHDLYSNLYLSPLIRLIENETFPIDEERYMILTEFDLKPYSMGLWKDFKPKLEIEDFTKINSCTNVDKIYENGEFTSYFIHKDD